ncbi:MAG: response regulator [Sulfurimonas sp.]|nr:response regulator [Sulfurimonas sp.]
MNLDSNILIYILEAFVLVGILYLYFRKKQTSLLSNIKELKSEIKLLKKELSSRETIPSNEESSPKTTSFITAEIKKREKLDEEIKRLHKIIEDTKNIAQDASMIKSDFLANIRHEIRTPMNSILVFAELLSKSITDKKLNTFAHNILNSGNKLLVLLDNIIELSKIESGTFEMQESAVDIKNFFDTSINNFKGEANKKGLELSVDIDEKIPNSLMIDPVRVNEILDNLLENAIKFTQSGFVKVEVVVDSVDEVNNEVDISISVKDSGIGIAEGNKSKIFEIFETKENCDLIEYQGTGLGLSINRKLSQLMNGNLDVESKLSKGSTFRLTLKGVEVVLSNEAKNVDESKIDFSLIRPSGAKVLVVDTLEENRELIQDCFLWTKIDIFAFDNAREAIELLKRQDVDLILIDVDMLSIDDGAVSKVLKTVSDALVVTLTNTRLKDIVFQDGGVKPVGHLKKPITKVELFKMLLKILNSQEVVFQESGNIVLNQKDGDVSLDDINFVQLKMFLHIQKGALAGIYKEAVSTNDLKAIEKFSNSLLELATKHRLKEMISYSTLLLKKIDLFEIDTINVMLKDYKKKIEQYESMLS